MAETETPTRSLRAATNPQARMQELLQRDAPPQPQPLEITALPVGSTTSSAVAQTTGSTDSSKAADTEDNAVTQQHSNSEKPKRSSAVAQKSSSAIARKHSSISGNDPVRQAMLGMLAQPYPDDMTEGAMTVTSVKIPKPIWERLEYARTITKRDKQDIIAEALRLYFDQILELNTQEEES